MATNRTPDYVLLPFIRAGYTFQVFYSTEYRRAVIQVEQGERVKAYQRHEITKAVSEVTGVENVKLVTMLEAACDLVELA